MCNLKKAKQTNKIKQKFRYKEHTSVTRWHGSWEGGE